MFFPASTPVLAKMVGIASPSRKAEEVRLNVLAPPAASKGKKLLTMDNSIGTKYGSNGICNPSSGCRFLQSRFIMGGS
jgi:hypothetical protein